MTVGSPKRRYGPWAAFLLLLASILAVDPAASGPAGPKEVASRLEALEQRIAFLESEVAVMELSAARFDRWMDCITLVPVSDFGDQDHGSGYAYDERDGTGLDHRPALAVDEGAEPAYHLLQFDHRDECQSATTQPGTPGSPGTADPALHAGPTGGGVTVADLERRLADVTRRAERLNDMAEMFDEWESCLSSVGVTEYGDPDGEYGYRYRGTDGVAIYAAALTTDISEWDDPDYFFLAFVGDDMPFGSRECGNEPGEATD
jgi:hypothetical protein